MSKRTKWFCLNVFDSFRRQKKNLVTILGKGKTRTKKSEDISQDTEATYIFVNAPMEIHNISSSS